MKRAEIIKVLKAMERHSADCARGMNKRTRLYNHFMEDACTLSMVIMMLEDDEVANKYRDIFKDQIAEAAE